jgi:hypothetical protein
MINEFQCERCGSDCIIDGDYPRFDCYCEVCKKEAEGFDVLEYAAKWYAEQLDSAADFRDDT